MKGYTDKNGHDRPPCRTCKHRSNSAIKHPCCSCVDFMDLGLHRSYAEIDFRNYEVDESVIEREK